MLTVDGVEMLEIREAAELANRSPETVRRWVWAGRLTAQRRGNRLLVARHDVERLTRAAGSADELTPVSLSTWVAEVMDHRRGGLLGDTATRGTAASLVLDDRLDRDER